MKIYQKYIVYSYLKNFFIIFLSLEFFYVGIDAITNYAKFPESANLKLLYVVFKILDAINYAMPLSIIFAMIVTKLSMLKSNELVVLYSCGLSKKSVIKPIFLTSIFLTFIYIILNFTPFVYAYEYSLNLLKYNTISKTSSRLFLKNDNQYIYFQNLEPLKKQARGIKIFYIRDGDLTKIVSAKSGYFKQDYWVLKDVKIEYKPKIIGIDSKGLEIVYKDRIEALKNFKPKIIENVHKGKFKMPIGDTWEAIKFFAAQNLNLDRLKTLLVSQILIPFFAPLLVLIFYFYLPASSRFLNATLYSSFFIFITLVLWGLLFVLTKLSSTSVIFPEVGVVLPMIILGLFALYKYHKEN